MGGRGPRNFAGGWQGSEGGPGRPTEPEIEEGKRRPKEEKKRKKTSRKEDKQDERKKLRIIFWNVARLGNKDEDFWRYIKKFDIINLAETWTEMKNWKRTEKWLPKEYRWEMQGANKDKKKGRSAGGMLTGIKNTLTIKNIEKGKRDMMSIEIEIEEKNWRFISVYNRIGKKEYLKNLEEEIERGGWRKTIIGGDFNARIAEQGGIIWNKDKEKKEEERRHSKDKLINRQGKDLMEEIEALGLGIMNGNMRGDIYRQKWELSDRLCDMQCKSLG